MTRTPHPALFAALGHALDRHRAACHGDARFIDDDVPAAALAPLCARCPVFVECLEYAVAARPNGGVWAGRRYGYARRREKAA